MADTIFISIAAYRDPELIPTINDCIRQAAHPENLRFGVGWQHAPNETFPKEWLNSDQFVVLDVPNAITKGVCWMRAMLQQQVAGETFFLQLDSHHRFAKNWDLHLIHMWSDLRNIGVPKPLLTSYVPSYDPQNDPAGRLMYPYQTDFDRFTPEGVVFLRPNEMFNWRDLRFPIPCRLVSAHFLFVESKWCKEVPYDYNYWFHGEEINLSARSYTWGYDLYSPHLIVVWHEYTRRGRTKVWDKNEPWEKYGPLDKATHLRNRKLFGMDNEKQDIDFGALGFGPVRTLADYERYTGINFKLRGVQQWTLDHKPPPNPQQFASPEAYLKSFLPRIRHCIDVYYHGGQLDDFDYWAVTFHDKDDKEVFRKDADAAEIMSFKGNVDGYCPMWRECHSDSAVKWKVRCHSRTQKENEGWLPLIEGWLVPPPAVAVPSAPLPVQPVALPLPPAVPPVMEVPPVQLPVQPVALPVVPPAVPQTVEGFD